MKRLYLLSLLIVTTILLCSSGSASAQTTAFTSPGGPYYYTVPNGTTLISVDMAGGQGGFGYSASYAGGKGGRVTCSMAVSGGQVLAVYVAGAGVNGSNCCSTSYTNAGGAGGATGGVGISYGGGGGGASDIRVSPFATANRYIVAAGGGGGSGYCDDPGGAGGGTSGANGTECGSFNSYAGAGATQTSNGAGSTTGPGGTGTQTAGGNGYTGYYYGAGGGGGYYSGGGTYGGGGGGGSSYYGGTGVTGGTTTGGFQTGAGYVNICSPNVGSMFGPSTICTGVTSAFSATGTGGTWSSSNTLAATIDASGNVTGINAGVTVISYAISNACGAGFVTSTVTVNATPSAITGAPSVCLGQTTTVSDPTGGGTWSSSAITRATVNSTSGLVTGLSLGTTTLSYTVTSTGCYSTVAFPINALPASITGAASVCAGGLYTTTFADAAPLGTWSSSATTYATVDPTYGIVTGGTTGAATISYTLPSGCYVTKGIIVNPLPTGITGTGTVCPGSTTTLTDAGGGTWSSSNLAVANVNATTGVVTGVASGSASISYSLPTGCATTTPILVNSAPLAITGVGNACVGATTTLGDPTAGGLFTSSSTALATVSPSGLVTGNAAGMPTITYTLSSTGCYSTTIVTINALPAVYNISGGGGYCTGTSGKRIGLVYSDGGISYKLYSGGVQVGSTVIGSNSGLDFGAFTAVGSYSAIGVNTATGCTNNMSGTTTLSVNPSPAAYAISGGGRYCPGGAGVNISFSGSDLGNNYQLYIAGVAVGGPISGTGSSISLGLYTGLGNYTAIASNSTTGCSTNMTGSATIANYPVPTPYALNAGGGYCVGGTGVHVTLSGSDLTTTYQLYNAGVSVGAAVTGTGSLLDFGAETTPGIYTVVGTNPSTTCTNAMTGSSTVAINPLPVVYTITGGGNYCTGGPGVHVGVNYSDAGVIYSLYTGGSMVASAPGANAGLDFGLQSATGTYSVVAVDGTTGCTKNMSGTTTVNTTPLPTVYNVTGGGSYCASGTGVHIGLNGTSTGVRYQVIYSGTASGSSVTGTGTSIDFGTRASAGSYTVVATNIATSCSSNMNGSAGVIMNPLPAVFTISDTASAYCAGGTGIDMQLSSSETATSYQLYKGGSPVGALMTGTGFGLDFGLQTGAGTYTVKATNTIGCLNTMAGSENVVINPLPFAYTVTGGGNFCAGGTGVGINLSGSNLNTNYQLNGTGGPAGLPVSGTGGVISFGMETDPGAYTITATDATTGCTSAMTGSATVVVNPVPDNSHVVFGGGAYCSGTTAPHIGLDGSAVSGVVYQLMNSGAPSGVPVIATGSALDFGAHGTPGYYTAIGTYPATGCSSTMGGSVLVSITPLPASQTVSGGGPYCAGGSGASVTLGGSESTVTYHIIYGGSDLGTQTGTGAGLTFGPFMGAGSYTVIGVDSSTTCIGNMAGSASISINPLPPVDSLRGGGAYCAGGTGVHVGLGSSMSGIVYQLYNGITAVGATVNGTGSPIDFGTEADAGTYTVVATSGGMCATNMANAATVSIAPLPAPFVITGGGTYCAGASGVAIGLSGSESGINYELYNGTTADSMVAGTGTAVSFGLQMIGGTFHATATNPITGCTNTMTSSAPTTVTILPIPNVYDVTGGGHYCTGGNGVHIVLNGSNTNINYQLMNGIATVGSLMAGTGTAIDFGLLATPGTYTVLATDAGTGCNNTMADAATVAVDPILTPVVSIVAVPGTTIVIGKSDTLIASASNTGTGATYQWFVNGFVVPGETTNRFISSTLGNNDNVSCEVTSGGACGGVTSANSVRMTVIDNVGVKNVATSNAAITVVPNPNKGTFMVTGTIGNNSNEAVSLQITDLLGHVVYNGSTVANNGNINEKVQLSSTLANGMYLLNLRSETSSTVLHIVIAQ